MTPQERFERIEHSMALRGSWKSIARTGKKTASYGAPPSGRLISSLPTWTVSSLRRRRGTVHLKSAMTGSTHVSIG